MLTHKDIKNNLKKDYSGFKVVKVAVLGDSATQFLVQSIKGYAYEYGLKAEVYEADFNQIEMEVFDQSSNLYAFQPDYILIQKTIQQLQYYFGKNISRSSFGEQELEKLEQIYIAIGSKLSSKIIYCNYATADYGVFGNYSNKTADSFLYQLRKINFGIMQFAVEHANFHVCDIDLLQSRYGRENMYSPSIFVNTNLVFHSDFLPHIAKNVCDIITACLGKIKKCLILDLDNTVWGGIIGDDGIENIEIGSLGIGKAFTELQSWAKQLKERGIILAICSKNNEEIAKEPFEKHPEMILRLEDISVFVANWENKADNIRYIQEVLNIGFDSMVFLDDNPFERNLVRANIPDVTVPELPEDPAQYMEYIYSLNLFETASYSSADAGRTKQYQEEAERVISRKSFTNQDEYLASLSMKAKVLMADNFNIPRISQLTQRSNQFNLRTIRYDETEIQRFEESDSFVIIPVSLEDKYGDYGLISVIILEQKESSLFVDTWIMSCRVLKRGVENFVMNSIVEVAKSRNINLIRAEYVPSKKNALVENLLPNMGFQAVSENEFELNVSAYKFFNTKINQQD